MSSRRSDNLAPGRTSKGVRKLRELEASAGKQIVMDRRKVVEEAEAMEDVMVIDKESFPLETIPKVSFAFSWGARRAR